MRSKKKHSKKNHKTGRTRRTSTVKNKRNYLVNTSSSDLDRIVYKNGKCIPLVPKKWLNNIYGGDPPDGEEEEERAGPQDEEPNSLSENGISNNNSSPPENNENKGSNFMKRLWDRFNKKSDKQQNDPDVHGKLERAFAEVGKKLDKIQLAFDFDPYPGYSKPAVKKQTWVEATYDKSNVLNDVLREVLTTETGYTNANIADIIGDYFREVEEDLALIRASASKKKKGDKQKPDKTPKKRMAIETEISKEQKFEIQKALLSMLHDLIHSSPEEDPSSQPQVLLFLNDENMKNPKFLENDDSPSKFEESKKIKHVPDEPPYSGGKKKKAKKQQKGGAIQLEDIQISEINIENLLDKSKKNCIIAEGKDVDKILADFSQIPSDKAKNVFSLLFFDLNIWTDNEGPKKNMGIIESIIHEDGIIIADPEFTFNTRVLQATFKLKGVDGQYGVFAKEDRHFNLVDGLDIVSPKNRPKPVAVDTSNEVVDGVDEGEGDAVEGVGEESDAIERNVKVPVIEEEQAEIEAEDEEANRKAVEETEAEEAERLRKEAEEAERLRKNAEDAERLRKEAEEAEKLKQEAEAEKLKKEQEEAEAERLRKEAEEAAAKQKQEPITPLTTARTDTETTTDNSSTVPLTPKPLTNKDILATKDVGYYDVNTNGFTFGGLKYANGESVLVPWNIFKFANKNKKYDLKTVIEPLIIRNKIEKNSVLLKILDEIINEKQCQNFKVEGGNKGECYSTRYLKEIDALLNLNKFNANTEYKKKIEENNKKSSLYQIYNNLSLKETDNISSTSSDDTESTASSRTAPLILEALGNKINKKPIYETYQDIRLYFDTFIDEIYPSTAPDSARSKSTISSLTNSTGTILSDDKTIPDYFNKPKKILAFGDTIKKMSEIIKKQQAELNKIKKQNDATIDILEKNLKSFEPSTKDKQNTKVIIPKNPIPESKKVGSKVVEEAKANLKQKYMDIGFRKEDETKITKLFKEVKTEADKIQNKDLLNGPPENVKNEYLPLTEENLKNNLPNRLDQAFAISETTTNLPVFSQGSNNSNSNTQNSDASSRPASASSYMTSTSSTSAITIDNQVNIILDHIQVTIDNLTGDETPSEQLSIQSSNVPSISNYSNSKTSNKTRNLKNQTQNNRTKITNNKTQTKNRN